jgi:hypothetical protein
MDDQEQSWHRLRKGFTDHVTEENERLVAHYESTADEWRFEGSLESERTFKAKAREAGFRLRRETGLAAVKHWLDALRRNQVAPVGPDSTTDPSTDGTPSRLSGPMPTAIDKLFSRSALFCLEWATEVSMRMRLFEQCSESNPDEPSEPDQPDVSGTEERSETIEDGEAFDWSYGISLPLLTGDVTVEDIEAALNEGRRREAVDAFIAKCNRETPLRVTKTHIWRAAGHAKPRQFQYWQAGQDRLPGASRGATESDDRNFRRIISLAPTEFVALLSVKGIS